MEERPRGRILDVDGSAVHGQTSSCTVSFPDLVRQHFSYVRHSLRRLGVAERDLDDVTQETFLAVHRKLQDYDPSRSIRPWLFGIAFRLVHHYRRHIRRHPESLVSDAADQADDTPGPMERLQMAEARDQVIAALDCLDLDRRAIFVLHEIDGVEVAVAAESLGILVSTAHSRLRLARADFAAALKRQLAARVVK